MSELSDKQKEFTKDTALLIIHAYNHGYDLTFGEAWRPSWVAQVYNYFKKGSKKSLHIERLAVDFNLFKDGDWLKETEDFRFLGEYWESIREGNCWGGRFGDGNHFSREHQGVR